MRGPVTRRKEGRLIRSRAAPREGRARAGAGERTRRRPDDDDDDGDSLHSQKFYLRGGNLCIRSVQDSREGLSVASCEWMEERAGGRARE